MKKKQKSKKPSPAPAVPPDQDIVALLTTLVQKLTSFEAKIDTVLSRVPATSHAHATPRPQPVLVSSPEARRDHRPMHKAVCADCHKECEVPFKPSGERPVYCKECFRTRRSNGTLKVQPSAPAPAVPVKSAESPKPVKPARSAAKKNVAKPAKPATKKPAGKARKK